MNTSYGLGAPNLAAAAGALDAALKGGCDCNSKAQALAVIDFQQAAGGLTVDAKYGPLTQAALANAMGGPAAAPCYGSGNPCFGKDAGPNAAMAERGLGGGGITPPGPGTVTPLGTTSKAMPPWAWWALGAAGVAAGIGLIMYVEKKKHADAPHGAPHTERKSLPSHHPSHASPHHGHSAHPHHVHESPRRRRRANR